MAKYRKRCDRKAFLKNYVDLVDDEFEKRLRFTDQQETIKPLLDHDRLSCEERIKISVRMGYIAGYYGVLGSVLCFSDPDKGWWILKQCLLYSHWRTRIACCVRDFWDVSHEEPSRPFDLAEHLAVVTSLSLSIASTEAKWYLDLMERSLDDASLSWTGDDFFAAYLVRLYKKLKGKEDIEDLPPKANDWVNPFGDFFKLWNNNQELSNVIRQMCDYHLCWNEEFTEDRIAEFSNPIAIVNPVEIHALEAVRTELGLSTPTVEHELLQPPFYPIPDFAKNITTEEILAEDDLLRRIVELNQPWCDGLEE